MVEMKSHLSAEGVGSYEHSKSRHDSSGVKFGKLEGPKMRSIYI